MGYAIEYKKNWFIISFLWPDSVANYNYLFSFVSLNKFCYSQEMNLKLQLSNIKKLKLVKSIEKWIGESEASKEPDRDRYLTDNLF